MTEDFDSPFGPDREAAEAAYRKLRHFLIRIFEWDGYEDCENLADEAIGRGLERYRRGVPLECDFSFYVIGIAKNVRKEAARRNWRERATGAEFASEFHSGSSVERTLFLEQLLVHLGPGDRDLVERRLAGDPEVFKGPFRVRFHRVVKKLRNIAGLEES